MSPVCSSARLPPAALSGDAEGATEQGLRGGCPEADDELGAHAGDLRLQPRAARLHLAAVRLLVDAALA